MTKTVFEIDENTITITLNDETTIINLDGDTLYIANKIIQVLTDYRRITNKQ